MATSGWREEGLDPPDTSAGTRIWLQPRLFKGRYGESLKRQDRKRARQQAVPSNRFSFSTGAFMVIRTYREASDVFVSRQPHIVSIAMNAVEGDSHFIRTAQATIVGVAFVPDVVRRDIGGVPIVLLPHFATELMKRGLWGGASARDLRVLKL